MDTQFQSKKPETDNTGVDCMIILKWISWEQGERVWIKCTWFRTKIGGGLL